MLPTSLLLTVSPRGLRCGKEKSLLYPGGYPRFIEEGFNQQYLPVWLQEASYNTYYVGKLMNGHSISTYDNPRSAGWNGSDCKKFSNSVMKPLLTGAVLIDPGTYLFYNATLTRNHEQYRNPAGEYSTDLIADTAIGFLDEAIAASDRPFFLGVAPIAPHSETVTQPRPAKFLPPVPAKRHEHLFPDAKVPRAPNFNPNTVCIALPRDG